MISIQSLSSLVRRHAVLNPWRESAGVAALTASDNSACFLPFNGPSVISLFLMILTASALKAANATENFFLASPASHWVCNAIRRSKRSRSAPCSTAMRNRSAGAVTVYSWRTAGAWCCDFASSSVKTSSTVSIMVFSQVVSSAIHSWISASRFRASLKFQPKRWATAAAAQATTSASDGDMGPSSRSLPSS